MPIIHLSFLFLAVTLAILFNNIVVYLVGISISLFLGMYTGSYVYNLEISLSKNLEDPSKFFSHVSGAEASAFLVAPILNVSYYKQVLFLSILLALIALGGVFPMYFRYFGGIEIKPKFFSGNIVIPKKVAVIAASNWFLQYLWMGIALWFGSQTGSVWFPSAWCN